MPPLPTKNLHNEPQTIHFFGTSISLSWMPSFSNLGLVQLQDPFLGLQTDLIVLSSFSSSTFHTPWKFLHIFVVFAEKQLNKWMALPNMHTLCIPRIETVI